MHVCAAHIATLLRWIFAADLSYADLWTLAGCVAIETTGGPTIPWKAGRTDSPAPGQSCPAGQKEKNIVEDGRLPDASQGAAHVREVFTRMGFNDREAVALCGAHTLGKCRTDRSGYDGPWTPEPLIFDNTYFTELLSREWVWKSDVDSSWTGPPQLVDKATGKLMMLPTDWALVAVSYTPHSALHAVCQQGRFDSQDPAYNAICKEFAASQDAFFASFAPAFAKLVELGCDDHVKTQCPHSAEARL